MHVTYTPVDSKPASHFFDSNRFASTDFTGKTSQFTKRSIIKSAAVSVAICLSLSGCGTMTNRGKSTAIGAGVGAVAGAVLTGGSAWGTVGGAAVGGVVGNQIGK
jgi:osmotically inducible lipoprotein OsmB